MRLVIGPNAFHGLGICLALHLATCAFNLELAITALCPSCHPTSTPTTHGLYSLGRSTCTQALHRAGTVIPQVSISMHVALGVF